MRAIAIRELHQHTGKFVRQAQKELVVVTDRGQQIAVLKGISTAESVGKPFPKRKLASLPRVSIDSTVHISEERDARCFISIVPISLNVMCLSPALNKYRLLLNHPGRACALHGRLEFWSGIKRHVRQGNLSMRSVEAAWRQFIADETAGVWLFLTISRNLVEMSCTRLAALPLDVACRAADALHFTCAVEEGFGEIYSNDRDLLAAAAYFGLTGEALELIGH